MSGPSTRPTTRGAIASIVGVAMVLTISNSVKPLVVDDAALVAFAEQISRHPTDPYGFEMLWWAAPEPANHILMPPVLPYAVGLAVAVFGDQPFLWKLALFPLLLLLAASLYGMLRRFAAGWEHPLLWMMLISPAVLPGVNLMLDVPALAFGMAALWSLLVAIERGGFARLVFAGLLAGTAMQTKYTAFVWLAVLLGLGWTFQRLRAALVAALVACALFSSWELFTALHYGESHLFHALLSQEYGKDAKQGLHLWLLGFTCLAGAMAPGAAGLACAGAGGGRRAGFALPALTLIGVALVAALPADPVAAPRSSLPDLTAPRPELFVFAPLGAAVLGTLGLGVERLLRARLDPLARRVDRFLALWLALETLACFAISPFLAGRRLLGWSVAAAFVGGRLALREGERRPALARCAVGVSIALGVLFAASDLGDALTRRRAIERIELRLAELGAERATQDVWFAGNWGFRYYAERSGMRPLIPGKSGVRGGDWLLIPEGVERWPFALPAGPTRLVGEVRVENAWPWSTLPSLYLGPIAIRAQPDAQLRVRIVHFDAPFIAPVPRESGA